MRIQILLSTTFFLFLVALDSAFAQNGEFGLPRGLTEEEKLLIPTYKAPNVSSFSIPVSAIRGSSFRTMAEWEEIQSVVITWTSFQAILAEIVRNLQKECEVIIICNNETTVKNYLNGKGVDWTQNVSFLVTPYNSIWVRDYGPNPVYQDDVDSLYLVDWIYNRPRPNDDMVPIAVGNMLGLPVISTTVAPNDLVHTGGNFMSDGLGRGFSSHLVLEENGPNNTYGTSNHDESAINDLMSNFMGIDPYIKMENLPFDGIHHIDMHMKLLDEQTLLVGEYPPGIADGPQIEANLQYVLNNFNTTSGTPFKVIRIPMPPDATGKFPNTGGHYRTYTNSLIANKTIIVPTYDLKYDTTALRIYREAMPGYHVVGIDCNTIIPSSGALHCITKEIGVNDPLRIVHFPIDGSEINNNGVIVDALIQHRDGILNARVYYTTDTLVGYVELPMDQNLGTDTWSATIPFLGEEKLVYYYIEAEATSGKSQRRPLTAPAGYWVFLMPEGTSSILNTTDSRIILTPPFPNPASSITCIPVDLGNYSGELKLDLIDVWGRSFKLFSGYESGGERKYFFNAGDFVAGIYRLRIQTAECQVTEMIVIQ